MAKLGQWHRNPQLRRLLLPLLKRFNPGDIRIRHHYTGDRLLLHSFRHKGYWFHGRRREQRTMEFFQRAIQPGDCVVEVGGHIGYVALYFSQLTGPDGEVIVFEPGSNNLPYLRTNTANRSNVTVVPKAASNQEGVATFYEEGLTGQNNSLLGDYGQFEKNRQRAFDNSVYQPRTVDTTRLDDFLTNAGSSPQLLKIDVEGAELLVLQGCTRTLQTCQPIIMVEVTEQKAETFNLLIDAGYQLFNDKGAPLVTPHQLNFNVCALHRNRHMKLLDQLGWCARKAA